MLGALVAVTLLFPLAACESGYISDDPDAAMRKEVQEDQEYRPDARICGDGELDEFGEELCDGDNLDGESCTSQGLPEGTLRCTENCDAFDTSRCLGEGVCGNGIVDGDEACEPTEGEGCVYDDEDCLICDSNCELVPGPIEYCGDDALQSRHEDCDGELLGDASCISIGFEGGVLTCDEGCDYDTNACEGALCGDGLVEGEEECEPDATNRSCDYGEPCQLCTNTCELVEGDYAFCGDGAIQRAYEGCDGFALQDSCESLGLGDGTLACGDDCEVDRSSCAGPDGCAVGASPPGLAWMLLAILGLRRRRT